MWSPRFLANGGQGVRLGENRWCVQTRQNGKLPRAARRDDNRPASFRWLRSWGPLSSVGPTVGMNCVSIRGGLEIQLMAPYKFF